MRIEAEERFYEKSLEKNEPVGVTSPSTLFFEDCFIVLIDDKVTIDWEEDMLHSESR